jgi:hypothetical protein
MRQIHSTTAEPSSLEDARDAGLERPETSRGSLADVTQSATVDPAAEAGKRRPPLGVLALALAVGATALGVIALVTDDVDTPASPPAVGVLAAIEPTESPIDDAVDFSDCRLRRSGVPC